MNFILIPLLLIILTTVYLFLTKPKNMPFMGHFADKILYGSLYYFDSPDVSYIYAKKKNVNLKLHFFIPKEPKVKSSVLLFHGGGWAFGSSYSLFKICKDLSRAGIFVWNEHSSSAEEMSKLFMLLCYSDQPLPKCSSSLFIIHFFIPYPL